MKKQLLSTEMTVASNDWKLGDDFGRTYTVQMSVMRWKELPNHPRQKDVERNAKKGHWLHARRATGPTLEALAHVVAGELDGRIYKVDGHTRGHLWQSGQLTAPQKVIATVYRCSSLDELKNLYVCFHASESTQDRVLGAYREHGLELKSRRLVNGTIVEALVLAQQGSTRKEDKSQAAQAELDVYEVVGVFKDELKLIDTVNPENELFITGLLAAALVAVSLNKKDLAFFLAISEHRGSKRDGIPDPVEKVTEHVNAVRNSGSAWVRGNHEELASRVLAALELWKLGPEASGYWVNGMLPRADLRMAVARMRKKKALPPI